MQFVADGPDIPAELLRAQEDGRLVWFCGAGVSKRAGLPLFGELVDEVCRALTWTRDAIEQGEFDRGNYDRVVTLLERRFESRDVRRHVRRLLAVPPDPRLDTHSALIKLATRDQKIRLVTTNFDRLFEEARPEIPATAAPLLPIPKPNKWNHLVHLHGTLSPENPDREQLVLSSADFGVAYLTERWASRFVGDLFNHFTVLFVGYSVDDPVMRYLVDAIAAERRADSRIGAAFVIAEAGADSPESTEGKWKAKGIVPILYSPADEHSLLHTTLHSWSTYWSGGLGSKINLVTRLAGFEPSTLRTEEVSQFLWAVADPSGIPARQLSERANVAWLEEIRQAGLLDGGAKKPASSGTLVEGGQHPLTRTVALVDRGQTTRDVASLDPVHCYLAIWLAGRLDDPAVARWAVKSGGRLHPQFMELVRRRLRESPQLPEGLRAAWLALSGAIPLAGSGGHSGHHLDDRVESEQWSPSLRSELLAFLAPRVELRESWASLSELDEAGYRIPRDSVDAILTFECELQVDQGSIQLTIGALRARQDYQEILRNIAFEVGALLRGALDIQASLGGASPDYDRSSIDHPSIESHEQNHHFHGWTTLIDLARDSFLALVECVPEAARALVTMWRLVPYPLFRRLSLFAARRGGVNDPDGFLGMMLADPVRWVWSSDVRLEFFRSLPWLWNSLSDAARRSLLETFLAGPPRGMFVSELTEVEWADIRDRWTWQRLARLRHAGVFLGDSASVRLAALEASHRDWRYNGTDREDFPSWTESQVGLRTDFTADQLLALTDDELIRVLTEHEPNREGLLDAWMGAVQLDRRRGIKILDRLGAARRLDPEVWSHGIAAFRNEVSDRADAEESTAFLLRVPPELLLDHRVARALADSTRTLSKHVPASGRSSVLALWDLVFPSTLGVPSMDAGSLVTAAINHPVGVLAEGLLEILRADSPARQSEIPSDVRARFERILDEPGTPARLGRVIIASRLAWLFDIDRAWASARVVPLLNWGDPTEARGAWQGFLWSPWLGQPLWSELKQYFLQTFDYLAEIGERSRTLGGAIAAVSIEGEGFLAAIEAADCLRKLGNDGREAAASWLDRALEGAGNQSAQLWRGRIHPWLEQAWPRESSHRGSGTSRRLAVAAARTGDAFPEAARLVAELIGPSTQPGFALDEISRRQVAATAPRECLSLINALVPDDPPSWLVELRPLLNQIVAADVRIADDPMYQRLHAIALRIGPA